MTCDWRPFVPPELTNFSPSWNMLWPSISAPAISPVLRGAPSCVVTMPSLPSGISRTFTSFTPNRELLTR